MSRSPTLAEVLNRFGDRVEARVRVALPGRVERYDAEKQLADVKPLVADLFEEEDGTVSNLSLPVIPSVPVVFPGAGGFRIVCPVSKGDTVLLIFADRSIDAWLDQGGETAPVDTRRHHLTDAIAVPGLHPFNKPWKDAAGNFITIGSDDGAADWVAVATKVKNEITALRNTVNSLVSAYNAHTHTVATTGTATAQSGTAAVTLSTAAPPAAVQDVNSQTVKVKG